jgi:hypothetical protein
MCNCKKQPQVINPQPIQTDMIVTERPTTEEELKQIEDFENKTNNDE